ncbi:aminotransferase [Gammaproteobacteria bacterium SCGC AG-212-F23]|nr:aminotransferase [Gammaproteobacteria bacterium SCGC AG-212-F23]
MHGLVQLPWWGYVVVTLVFTQITIVCVTVFLHRCQAHRALDLHPIASQFFRFWLWLTTGMVTKEWTAVHRKHHAKVETAEDPHSPIIEGIWKVLFKGTELYRLETRDKTTLERYGEGTPDDWMERHVYTGRSKTGIFTMLTLNLILFGPVGLTIWALQMAWIPFFAAGVVNGVAHYWGYRNFESPDASRNLLPIGFFIGGEELHNNHHTYATSAKFSVKWWEFDSGWLVIRALQSLGLAKPKRVPPQAKLVPGKLSVDIETLKAILTNRFQVMAKYSKTVILPVLREERRRAGEKSNAMLHRVRTLLIRDTSLLDAPKQAQLQTILTQHGALNLAYQFRLKLQNIWAKSSATQKELVDALQEWCHQAEASGLEALRDFVKYVKAHAPHAV